MKKKLYHLSHTDLDGYSCQLVAKNYFKDCFFSNSNYGNEIDERINEIILHIDAQDQKKDILFLITDLNLTMEQSKRLNDEIEKRPNVELLLLDHHISGQDAADTYKWYYLDINRCATKITYDYFSFLGGQIEELSCYVNIVNAIDIWLENDDNFELGKVFMKLVSSSKEISKILFPAQNNKFIFFILEEGQKIATGKDANIKLDDSIHKLKKGFFIKNGAKNNTLDNLISGFVVKLLSEKKDEMSIFYNGSKGILTYNIGNVSVLGNDFLKENPDFHFFMDIASKKTVSIRANGAIDVSLMAKHLFGGGGHKNASGGIFNQFKDSFLYKNIKAQIEDHLIKKG